MGRGAYRVLVGRPDEKYHLEDVGIEKKRIILKWISRKLNRVWNGLIWLAK